MTQHDLGDVVRITGAWTQAGVAVDPTTVQFNIKTPAGATTTYNYPADAQLVKDSVGNYHVDYAPATVGKYPFWWVSTGAGQAAGGEWIEITPATTT